MTIYRDYKIMPGSNEFPFHVYTNNGVDVIYCASTEVEAHAFIDKRMEELTSTTNQLNQP